MITFDIGPAYIKSTLIFKDKSPLSEYFISEVEKNKSDLEHFIFNLKDDLFEGVKMYFFKINLFRVNAFKKSLDYKIIKAVLSQQSANDTAKNGNTSNNLNSELTTANQTPQPKVAYYCGPLLGEIEKVIISLFDVQLVKLGHVNQLSIYGLEYIADNIENSFFDLPGQSIYNLVQVGHKLNEVTQKNVVSLKNRLFPFLFANIIDGVSVYRVDAIDKFTRIGGTTFGATTYWSLVSLTCGYDDPEIAVKDAIKGNNELIDLSVGDIYGGSYDQFNLNSSLIASSFGKLRNVQDVSQVKKEDISRSLMTLLCMSISQITAMLAKNLHIDKVIILGNPFECLEFMQMVQMATNYFSGETVNSYFSDYAPYINLIGLYRQMQFENIPLDY